MAVRIPRSPISGTHAPSHMYGPAPTASPSWLIMPLDIRNPQFYETAAAWVWMAVVLPAANRARHGGTAWCFLHSKEESGVHAVFFLTVWIIGSIGAMACWVARVANHRTIPEHTASLLFLACHGALILVATGFEVHSAPCPHERR